VKILFNPSGLKYKDIYKKGEKMKKLLLVASIILLCSLAFAWNLIRQTAFPTNFYCMEKIGNIYWAGGYVGAVAKSTDEGLTWRFVETPAYNAVTDDYKDVWDIDFINEMQGIMVGDDGLVALTNDGGVTWIWPQSVQNIIGTTRMYGAVYFPDGRIWICGYEGKIGYSPDYGVTWTLQAAGVTTVAAYSISMNESGIGFVALNKGTPSQSKILKTTNFGQNWTLIELPVTDNPSFNKVRQFGNKVVLCGDKGYVGYSNDNGNTWTHYAQAGGSSTSMRDVTMEGNLGYAVGRNATIIKTTDGWATWQVLTHNVTTYIEGIKIRDDGSLLACGWQGTLMLSNDGGISWEDLVPNAIDLWQASIVDANNWYVVGDKGTILKTTDGGHNLVKKNIFGNTSLFYTCYFKNVNEGWVTGKTSGNIYHTVNGGDSWSFFTIPNFSSTKAFYEIFFVNEQIGYIVGLGGKVTKTTDGGETWFTVGDNISSSTNLYCTYWKDEMNGYAGSSTGLLYITNNGGVTWSSITVGANANIRDIYFRDVNNGVLVKEGGEIYYTTTGGNTATSWLAASEQAIGHIMSVTCDHNGVYWAAGYSSNPSQQGNSWAIMKSLDNGATWIEESFPPLTFNPTQLTNISTGGGKIVAVGKNNVILAQLEVPEHVILISPPDNSTGIDPQNVILTWAPSPYGSVAAYYGVYVSPTPEALFDYYYFETTETSFNLSTAPLIDLGYGNTWFWAVLPVNEVMDTPDPDSGNFMIWRFTTMTQTTLEPPIVRIEKLNGQIIISWDAVSGATNYNVYGASNPYGNFTLISTTSELLYTITNPGNMQFFKVTASNE